jgi:hypothetical protein
VAWCSVRFRRDWTVWREVALTRIMERSAEERVLGVAAKLLMRRQKRTEAALLLDVKTFYIEPIWGQVMVNAIIEVEEYMIERFTDEARQEIFDAIHEATRDQHFLLTGLLVRPSLPDGVDWRQELDKQLQGRPLSNASMPHSARPALIADRLPFRDPSEMTLYKVLKRVQERAEPLGISVNLAFRVHGRTLEVDFLITYRGRVGIIEVDGLTHAGRRSWDRSKDHLLEDAGIFYVDRIDVADAENEAEASRFVERFLSRLAER